MAERQRLTDSAAVETWLAGLRQHWGGDPERDDPERLEILEAFCAFAERDPDAIIDECVRVRDGGKTIRAKGRRRYAGLIAKFQSQVEGPRLRRAKWGNTIRSFLIHNGVLFQSGLQAGEGSRD
ncbi:MAG: hypothetical protein IH958_01245 [Chloroflexi bacterium]|nr:hypothetical protein [Chloroflexota bacterium]